MNTYDYQLGYDGSGNDYQLGYDESGNCSGCPTVRWYVLALLRRRLLAATFDDMRALLRLHVLEAVDQCEFLLLGWRIVSVQLG
jgi:hypothetical protein